MTDTNYKIVSNTLMPPNEKTDKIGCMLSVKHAGCKLARKMTCYYSKYALFWVRNSFIGLKIKHNDVFTKGKHETNY